MSRQDVREAARQVLSDLPVLHPVRAIKVPSVIVSTPSEESIDDGFDTVLTVEVSVYERSEDDVDSLLGKVETAFAGDESLGGTVRDLQFSSYELDVNVDGTHIGTQSWTAIPTA